MSPPADPDATRPHRLPANPVPQFYAGGERIGRFRGAPAPPSPEDWVASTTALPGAADPETGLSRLPGGRTLRAAVAADPAGWLGPEEAPAAESALLVKLLDAGERLPVHWHPSRESARRLLGSPRGKTEAWIVLRAGPGARVWLGLARELPAPELRAMIAAQDGEAMLAALNERAVAPGDVLHVPGGTLHAIGSGILICELQEPTALSVLAEHGAFGLDEDQATLGLGWERALETADLRPGSPWARRPGPPGEGLERLLPADADPFFRAWRAHGPAALGPPGFAVLVVTGGEGELAWAAGRAPARAGETWVAPAGAGALEAAGDLELLVCRPPAAPAVLSEP